MTCERQFGTAKSSGETIVRPRTSVAVQWPPEVPAIKSSSGGHHGKPQGSDLTYERVWAALGGGTGEAKRRGKAKLSLYLKNNRWLTYKLPNPGRRGKLLS